MKELSARWLNLADRVAEAFVSRVADLLAFRIAEIVLDRLTHTPLPLKETFTLADLHIVFACESPSAVYRTLESLKVCAYAPGKYRRRDVLEAIARASFRERQARGWESLAKCYKRGPNE